MNQILSEEEQQLKEIKQWLMDNLALLIGAALVVVAVIWGPSAWTYYKNKEIFPVSDRYEVFRQAVTQASSGAVATDAELQRVDALAEGLIKEHGDTYYAFLASLSAAKISVDQGHFDAALSRLLWAESKARNEADKQLVNMRLAIVESHLGDTDSAIQRLLTPNEHFRSLYAEIRADLYAATGERELAIGAYQEAIDSLSDDGAGTRQQNLELKLGSLTDGLGSLDAVTDSATETPENGTAATEASVAETGVSELDIANTPVTGDEESTQTGEAVDADQDGETP